MNFDPNPLFFQMVQIFKENWTSEKKITICNEGSSRSSKTWDTFHFIVAYCSANKGKEIYVLRDTLTNCKDFTLKDFVNCLTVIGIYKPENLKNPQKPEYNLNGNMIFFRGMDDEKNAEGYPSDMIFVNEALETTKTQVDGIRMRCREIEIFDWNPKFSRHWCYDLKTHKNIFFTHSTYKNNKHLQRSVVEQIESYNPDIEENVIRKTADPYRWAVYGLGLKAQREGLVFPDVTWIDLFPNLERVSYGLDFGYTVDPTAIVKVGRQGLNLYIEYLYYKQCDDMVVLAEICKKMCVNGYIVADAHGAGKGMIGTLRHMGLEIYACKEFHGSIMYGINLLKRFKLHIVNNSFAVSEQENYVWKMEKGEGTNTPIDKFNHGWDAIGYVTIFDHRQAID